ncbi:unnamed protein product, partial [marine sediment metagenome]
TTWFAGAKGCVGIVIGEEEFTGERKAFIGAANGRNENADAEAITAWGIRLSVAVLQGLIKKLEVNSKVTKKVTGLIETWKCHICGEERPDDKISVLSKPLIINGQACGEQNIRYCNDRPGCLEGAKGFSFFKEG